MRTNPLTLALVGLLGLSACAGAGRPSADETLKRLNAAGVTCTVQDTRLKLANGAATEKSCRTDDGIEIGITRYGSDDDQEVFLDRAGANTSGTVFTTLVYDYAYILFVPDEELGARVTNVMDAQFFDTGNAGCPQAVGGVCGPTTLGGG